jgi:acetyltransferase
MKPDRAGYLMMRNLLAGGFNGPVLPVTPAWKAVQGYWPGLISPACPCAGSRRAVYQRKT